MDNEFRKYSDPSLYCSVCYVAPSRFELMFFFIDLHSMTHDEKEIKFETFFKYYLKTKPSDVLPWHLKSAPFTVQ